MKQIAVITLILVGIALNFHASTTGQNGGSRSVASEAKK